MICPSCGHDNREGARFCDSCASPITLVCANCGTEARPSAAFCDSCGQPLTDPSSPSLPQTKHTEAPTTPTSFANDRYQVKQFLGEGGKKKVYLAHDTTLDRDVAFSLIKTEGLDETGRIRISREAQAMGRLGTHPNIVTVFDLGEEPTLHGRRANGRW